MTVVKIKRLEEKKKILVAKIDTDKGYRLDTILNIKPSSTDYKTYLLDWLWSYYQIAPPWARKIIKRFIKEEVYDDIEDASISWKIRDFYSLIVLIGNIWKRTCGE